MQRRDDGLPRPSLSGAPLAWGAEQLEEKLLERGTHDASLPAPGTLVHVDHRSAKAKKRASEARESVRVVQWNIERGYRLDDVIAQLRALDADILLLQEIDVGCDRSDNRDTGPRFRTRAGCRARPLQ